MGEYPTYTGDLPKYIGEVIKTEMKSRKITAFDISHKKFDGVKFYERLGFSSQNSVVNALNHIRNGRLGNVKNPEETLSLVLFALEIEEGHELIKIYRDHCKEKGKKFIYPPECISLPYYTPGDNFRQKEHKKSRKKTKIEKVIDKDLKKRKRS